jgi:hypothetical protein
MLPTRPVVPTIKRFGSACPWVNGRKDTVPIVIGLARIGNVLIKGIWVQEGKLLFSRQANGSRLSSA